MQFAESVVRKLHIYLLLFSFAVCLLAMAVMKLSQNGPAPDASKAKTTAERLRILVNTSPQSQDMSGFLRREKSAQEASREVNGGLP